MRPFFTINQTVITAGFPPNLLLFRLRPLHAYILWLGKEIFRFSLSSTLHNAMISMDFYISGFQCSNSFRKHVWPYSSWFPPWCHGSVWTLRRTGNPAVHRPQRQKLTVTSLQRRLHDRRWWCPNLQRRFPYTLGCTDHKNGSMKFKCPKISYIYGCPVCACKNRCSNTYYGRMVHLVKSQTHNT